MGLLDVLNGMQNGPRGQVDPNAARGMSPITMAVLGLLAYKALKNFGANRPAQTSPIPGGAGMPGRGGGAMPGSGALGGLLGGLGGLLAGGAAGSALSGGLADLVRRFEQAGHGDVAHSWVGPGGNQLDRAEYTRGSARRRSDRCAHGANRLVEGRVARWAQPRAARGRR
jgi:uncharacterized protein YidB (DUF937 family)